MFCASSDTKCVNSLRSTIACPVTSFSGWAQRVQVRISNEILNLKGGLGNLSKHDQWWIYYTGCRSNTIYREGWPYTTKLDECIKYTRSSNAICWIFMQCKIKCTEGWPMKVHSIGIYRRERDQCNIQNYKFEKPILQIQLNAEHNSFRVWFERHQCIPTELKRQSLVKICNTGFWWHLLFRAGKSGNCTVAFRKVQKAEEDVEKIWSKAHREKRDRPLLTNVLKHCKNATRLKSQHLGCSACTI